MKTRNLIQNARTLRIQATEAEKLLWSKLRGRQVEGFKFRRQQPIGSFVADFVCLDRKLVIEVDGGQHAKDKYRDRKRDTWMREQGFEVLRFWNHEVFENLEEVLETIRKHLMSPSP